MVNEKVRQQGQDHGLWSSRLQKRRFARSGDAGDRARPRQTHWQRKLGAHLRETRTSDGPGETSLRKCRSLCRAGVLAAELSAGAEHTVVRRVTRSWLVCARYGATRS